MEKKGLKRVGPTCVTKSIVIDIDVPQEAKIHQIVLHLILDLDVQKINNIFKIDIITKNVFIFKV